MASGLNEVEVVVGVVSNHQNQVLIAKRPEHWLGGGFWEFPGGKVEINEEPVAALKRELMEEVGITVLDCEPLIQYSYHYPERKVNLRAFHIKSYLGQPIGLEGQEVAWCSPSLLSSFNMLPANRSIVTAIKLPNLYLITPNCYDLQPFLDQLQEKLKYNSIGLLQLRSKNLKLYDYVALAEKVIPICRQFRALTVLNTECLDLVAHLKADGIHLNSNQLFEFEERPLPYNQLVSASCHNSCELKRAEKLMVDFVTLSPVASNQKSRDPLGWKSFEELVSMANIPVFAQGGMTKEDCLISKALGGQGVAGISRVTEN